MTNARRNHFRTGFSIALLMACVTAAPAADSKKPAAKSKPTAAPAAPAARAGISKDPYIGAIVADVATGRVLFEDQADAKGYPASVLKLMDLLIILERIDQGKLSLRDPVVASARAAKTGGSQVWLAEKESFPVEDMLYALMVQSANDVAVALAEKVAGTTDGFVDLMNEKAKALGMTSTKFSSVHGLPPSAGQAHDITTARDLARLCLAVVKRKDALQYTSARERVFRPNGGTKKVVMRTHNHLLGSVEGVDGLKTGYIGVAGFSIAVTASRNGQRLIAVVLGSSDRKVRDAKAAEILAKGFAAIPVAAASGTASRPAPAR